MNVNHLLFWLSARGSGTWSRYQGALDDMQPDGTDDEDAIPVDSSSRKRLSLDHRIRLNLERLGHVEFFREQFPHGWRIVPPTLSCTVTKHGAIGILCGA